MFLPKRLIEGIASKASHAYKEYTIPKRAGGHRTIHHPSKPLKAIQRWLLGNIIATWPVHDAAYAYRLGKNIRHHAHRHVASRYLLRMDILEFFPSITADDLRVFLDSDHATHRDWGESDRELFIQLVCRFEELAIGAPSSPGLSNAVCFDLDVRLTALAQEVGATYTRYADDLFFSTNEPNILRAVPGRVTTIFGDLACPSELELRNDKTRHSSKRGRRQVTGLVLSSDGTVSVGRSRKRFIRHQIHRLATLDQSEREQLAGLIAFAVSIEPDFMNALVMKYGPATIEIARRAHDAPEVGAA
jgi:RNA-directed DNA polymerase